MKTPEKLGYEEKEEWSIDLCSLVTTYYKHYKNAYIELGHNEEHKWVGTISDEFISSQQDIDNIQIAFNNLQRDLKELNDEIKRN